MSAAVHPPFGGVACFGVSGGVGGCVPLFSGIGTGAGADGVGDDDSCAIVPPSFDTGDGSDGGVVGGCGGLLVGCCTPRA